MTMVCFCRWSAVASSLITMPSDGNDQRVRSCCAFLTAARNANALQDATRTVLDETLKTGFTQAEVDQGVRSLLNYLELGRSDDAYLAGRWIDYLDTDRDFAWQQRVMDQLRGLKAEQVNAAMRDLLEPDRLSIAVAADPDPKP